MTPVTFRNFDNDFVVAIFTKLPGEYALNTNLTYTSKTGFGEMVLDLAIRASKPATVEQYQGLADELHDMGYNDLIILDL